MSPFSFKKKGFFVVCFQIDSFLVCTKIVQSDNMVIVNFNTINI